MLKNLLSVMLFLAFMPFANASDVAKSGQFEGRSDHQTIGGVSIVITDGQTLLVLEEEFALDGAPDPKIGFGKDGFDSDTIFSKLEKKEGAQVYVIPNSIEVDNYNEVYIWCEKFNIPLGVARFSG